ncbi:rod shape-determining protein RodA [Roseospira navarrensis]|uniref:Peptidoglycan glycosyltransferase MrdB n=1 Tax=Roseospira navarrensis TaxID=140058 RepID=A0A7X1ZGS7_9PROT|nr:rod shape-determining protein RodA [Roseospira navarrensis]MQX37157.1 rod shape-determining protein RodA [Roseospira navarrensis]
MIGDGLMTSRMRRGEMTLGEKLWQMSWSLILLIGALTGIGVIMLYSAANGSMDPWASRHIMRFGVGLVLLVVIAMIDIRQWMRYAYWLYALAFVLLVAVEVKGTIGMGAQRWIDLGVVQLQPSELMKVTLVLALARFFHGADLQDVGRPLFLIVPALLALAPVALVLKQPDLGTALMLLAGGGVLFFAAGVRLWLFGLVVVAGLGTIPVAWQFLHDYQKNRVLTFINPERDPLGAGYHILQSKIALGSGGLTGKGFLQGTQSHLNFLPEKQTDFIFVMLAEEFGMLAGMGLLFLYVLVLAYGLAIALRARNHFGRLVAIGMIVTFFLYVFINIAMVMGLIPVVGVPLPFVSYGGTAMLTLMIAFGLLMSVWVHRDVQIGRRGAYDDG